MTFYAFIPKICKICTIKLGSFYSECSESQRSNRYAHSSHTYKNMHLIKIRALTITMTHKMVDIVKAYTTARGQCKCGCKSKLVLLDLALPLPCTVEKENVQHDSPQSPNNIRAFDIKNNSFQEQPRMQFNSYDEIQRYVRCCYKRGIVSLGEMSQFHQQPR